jgi:tol-pal system protein YbgF
MAKLKRTQEVCRWFQAAAVALLLTVAPTLAQSETARPAKGAAASAAQPADDGLKSRVDTLEEQLVDMQVVVGTLESLAKSGGSAPAAYTSVPAAGAASGADGARIDGLETQVRALTAQVQQLSDQIRSMGGLPRKSEIPAPTNTADAGAAEAEPGDDAGPQAVVSGAPNFGSTTVSQGGADPIGGLLKGNAPPAGQGVGQGAGAASGVAAAASPVATAALPPAGEVSNDPKQLYETAYGYLLQRDYGAAEVAFDDFLKKFPNDSLSGNAQYWLGETHFVRGQYKAAAESFLKGYQTYAQSAKAPDSLLKLAMSLDRLGQKDAACSSFAELSSKFPEAPQSVKARAQSERQRVGCR